MRKRLNNVYDKIISIENIILADRIARKDKKYTAAMRRFDRNYEQNIADIARDLSTQTYRVPDYRIETVYDKKEREISILPFRDRIVQHAILNVLRPMFMACFIKDTYCNLKHRGTHKASKILTRFLRDVPNTTYCLKLDVRKYYPNVNNEILKGFVHKKIKDKRLLWLMDEFIDSARGLPAGNSLSGYLSNLYLTHFDHWIKQEMGVKYYLRYNDDQIFLHSDIQVLHRLHAAVTHYMDQNLKLRIKPNVGPFEVRFGIDTLGYVHYHTHTRLRKTVKKDFARAVCTMKKLAHRPHSKQYKQIKQSVASRKGFAKHCNSRNLIKKLFNEKI